MIQTEQIIFRNTYVSTHIHVIIINENGSMGSKRTRSGICDRKGGLRKKKYWYYIIISLAIPVQPPACCRRLYFLVVHCGDFYILDQNYFYDSGL